MTATLAITAMNRVVHVRTGRHVTREQESVSCVTLGGICHNATNVSKDMQNIPFGQDESSSKLNGNYL
jgi:hypothetical protein